MSIESPTGILDIRNATLKVSKLEVTNATGFDTALNNIARNTILLVDSTEQTASNSWALKLPNAWVGEFEGYWSSGASGNIDFNFYNNTTSGTNGYTLSMDDTTIVVKYDGATLQTTTLSSTLKTSAYRKVHILFERDTISVSIDGSRELYFKDSSLRSRVYDDEAGGYITVGGLDSTNRKFKNLKVVNEKWISDGTSNIAYVGGGEVAIGQSLNLQQVSNVAQIKSSSNVVTEFVRSKKFIKYPRVALTSAAMNAYENGYKVTYSNQDSTYPPWKVFDNDPSDTVGWYSGTAAGTGYNGTNGAYNGTTRLASETELGEWIGLEVPTSIKLYDVRIVSQSYSTASNTVDEFYIYAKKQSGDAWTNLGKFTGIAARQGTPAGVTVNVDSTDYYTFFALVATKRDIAGAAGITIRVLDFFGVPEYDPEAHGTDVIMRSVPNVPNTDWLEVYWDGQDYTSMPATVTDKSGNGVTGTPNGGVGFDTEYKAFTFDAETNQYITATTTNQAGEFIHTVSMWVKFLELTDSQHFFFSFGSTPGANFTAIRMYYSSNLGIRVSCGVDYRTKFHPTPGEWFHVTYTYEGGILNQEASDVSVKFYVNGMQWAFQGYYQGTTPAVLNLPGTNTLQINGVDGVNNIYVDTSVANFRLFNRALTGDEVWQLYAYQKEYFDVSPDVVTFKGGRLGIGTSEPRAVLDVRGSIQANGHPVWPVPVAQFYKASPGTASQTYTENITRTGRVDFNRTLVETPGVIERYTWTSSTSRTTSDASSGGIIKFCLPGVYYVTAGVSIAKQLTHDKGFGFDFYQASVLGGYLRAGYAGGNPSYGSVTPDTQVNSVDGHRRMWMVRVTEAPAYGYIFIQPSNNSGSYFRFQTYTENPYAHVDIFYLG